MNTNVYFPAPRATKATKALWGAITVLGISTLAMGAALVQVHTGQADALVHNAAVPTAQAAATVASPAKTTENLRVTSSATKYTKPVAQKSARPTATTSPTATATAIASREDAVPQDRSPLRTVVDNTKPACPTCGTVESVTPVQRESAPIGVGAVAGAVLGGIVGNQVGQGDGKTIATILGVLGGGWAGHSAEKKMKVETVYQVQVRMDDGTTRTLEQQTAPAVGTKVTVEGNTLGPATVPVHGNSKSTDI